MVAGNVAGQGAVAYLRGGRTPAWIDAGPLLGHVGPHSVHVWVRRGKKVDLRARGSVVRGARHVAVTPTVEGLGDRIQRFVFRGLPPAAELIVQLYRGAVPNRGVAFVVRTAPRPAELGRVRIAFGAGCDDVRHGKPKAFRGIAAVRPDLFLFLGDTTFYVREVRRADEKPLFATSAGSGGDWSSAAKMLKRQLRSRRNEWLAPLARQVPIYAVWGQHDYGPDGAGAAFAGRRRAAQVFAKMWANPPRQASTPPGCGSSFRRGPVEVFLLDARYHRARDVVWGGAQLDWLCAGLAASRAPVKVIASATPLFGEHARWAPAEVRKLMAFLRTRRIDGVLWLAGGGEGASSLRLQRRRKGESGPLRVECVAASLARDQSFGSIETGAPGWPWRVRGDGFCVLTVDLSAPGQGSVTLDLRTRKGAVRTVAGRALRRTFPLAVFSW